MNHAAEQHPSIVDEPVFTTLADVRQALLTNQPLVVRLTENHYLVHWQPNGALWCVVDMADLDQHAETCSVFRYRQFCEHLQYIYEICTRKPLR